MDQQRLSSLAIKNIEREVVNKIDIEKVIKARVA